MPNWLIVLLVVVGAAAAVILGVGFVLMAREARAINRRANAAVAIARQRQAGR